LDPEVLKNFRPVSNLTFISKLIERVVALRLNEHLTRNKLQEVLQSAYRQYHSTETALLKVQNDLLTAIDTDGGAILVLLDLSAAFDTIDHKILIQRLYDLGIRGAALNWFKSYLSERTQSVTIKGVRSEKRELVYGVPQGSVLGPILFTIYTIPLGKIAKKYNLLYHIYADDTQLYISFRPADPTSQAVSVDKILKCFNEIKDWMTVNLLKLNGDKTELLIVTNKKYKNLTTIDCMSLDSASIYPSTNIRNLGAIFDNTLDMEAFINAKCKAARYSLRNISRVRKSLTTDACKIIVQAYVTSKLDYCNSLLYGLPSLLINRLQKVQNTAARVITLTPKWAHISPVRAALHWLPVQQRIEYKVLLYVYKALNGMAPAYLSDLLVPYVPNRCLRSAGKHYLQEPRARLKTYGHRAFMSAAPRLWNALPEKIKCADSVDVFKCQLKTHLFNAGFM